MKNIIIFSILVFFLMCGTASAQENWYTSQTEVYDWDTNMSRLANTLRGETRQETINNTLEYVATNYKYNYTILEELTNFGYTLSAQEVFYQNDTICVGYSRLTVSLLRINRIESTSIVGFVKNDSGYAHEWVKVLIDDVWIEYEPQTGQLIDDTYTYF